MKQLTHKAATLTHKSTTTPSRPHTHALTHTHTWSTAPTKTARTHAHVRARDKSQCSAWPCYQVWVSRVCVPGLASSQGRVQRRVRRLVARAPLSLQKTLYKDSPKGRERGLAHFCTLGSRSRALVNAQADAHMTRAFCARVKAQVHTHARTRG